MQYNLQYYPEPGIAYDIAKMCFVKLNSPNTWQESLTVIDSENNYASFIQEQANLFPKPKSEALVFSYIPANKSTTFLSTLVSKLISKNFCSFSVSDIISYFDNTTEVQNDLFSYYFGKEDYTDVDIDHIIRHSTLISDKIKIMLLGYSLYPAKYISCLTKTILDYYSIIQDLLDSHSDFEADYHSFIDFLISDSNQHGEPVFSSLNNSVISYSICLTTPVFLYYSLTTDRPFFITTQGTICHILQNNMAPPTIDLIQSTQAISDPHRFKIINLLISQKQLSLQDLMNNLNLSSTAVKYHISILKKADLIRTTRSNRKILYSHNPAGFRSIIRSLEKMEKGETLQ